MRHLIPCECGESDRPAAVMFAPLRLGSTLREAPTARAIADDRDEVEGRGREREGQRKRGSGKWGRKERKEERG